LIVKRNWLAYEDVLKVDDDFEVSYAEVLEPGHVKGDGKHVDAHHDEHHLE
jgi:hypothetical protein